MRHFISLLSFGLVCLVSTPGWADDRGDCFGAHHMEACLREGDQQRAGGDLEAARAAYLEGWKAQPGFALAAALGETELALGLHAEAYTHLRFALETLPESDAGRKSTLEAALAEALTRAGGRRLVVTPPDATIAIDGEGIDPKIAGSWLGLAPGTHQIVAARDGFTAFDQTVEVAAGSEEPLPIVLTPNRDDGEDEARDDVPSSEESALSGLVMPLGIAGGIVTAAAIGVGIGVGVAANGKADEVEALSASFDTSTCPADPRCAQIDALEGSKTTLTNATIGVAVVGGVVALVAGTIIVVAVVGDDDEEEDEEEALLVPLIAPDQAGLGVVGHF